MIKTEIQDAKAFVDSLNPKPDVLLAVTDNPKLNLELVRAAKSLGCMVYSVDNPVLSDFIFACSSKGWRREDCGSTSGRVQLWLVRLGKG